MVILWFFVVTSCVFTCTHSYEVLSPFTAPLLSGRTSRRTPVPKGLVVTVGPSAEAPTSYRPRWTEPSTMRGTQKNATQRSSICIQHLVSLPWAIEFSLIYFSFELLRFVGFTGCNSGLVALSNAQISHIELSALGKGCEVCCIDYMLTWRLLFLAAGLRAVWCPPQWQRPVVPWQEIQLWVKIMLLLACTTYLTNM